MKKILVVGAGKGIGFETVKLLLGQGHEVVAISKNVDALVAIKHSHLITKKCDITNENNVTDIVHFLVQQAIQFDRVLLTAGLLIKKEWSQFTQRDLTEIYQTNVFSVYTILKEIVVKKLYTKDLQVVTIGSMGGVQGSLKFSGMIHYSSSKAALACMTECLAEEWKELGIRINCLALGAVETAMKNAAFPDFKAPHSASEMAEWISVFLLQGGYYFNGKQLPVSVSTP